MIFCRFCSHRVDVDCSTRVEGVAWCPHCHKTFDVPIFIIPGWAAGALCVVFMVLYLGPLGIGAIQ